MKKNDIKESISKILQNKLSKKEREELKIILKSDPELKNDFIKKIGFFMALKAHDDLELEKIIEKYKFRPPPEREIER
jgi:hypothetical protein